MGVEFEAFVSPQKYHAVPVFPGIGLDLQVIARDVSWDIISSLLAAGDETIGPEVDTDYGGYTVAHSGLPKIMAQATFYPPQQSEGGAVLSRRLRWVPMRSLGGSHPFLLCFRAQDSSGLVSKRGNVLVPHKTQHGCVALLPQRCRYAVQKGETMQDIAAFYSTNWIQLWALNSDIVNPDGALTDGSIVSVGHIYTISEGDVIDWVVRKFGSSRNQILANNYDVATSSINAIGVGQPLCIIPNSCSTHL